MINPTSSCKFARTRTKVCLKGKTRCDSYRCKEFQLSAKAKKDRNILGMG